MQGADAVDNMEGGDCLEVGVVNGSLQVSRYSQRACTSSSS